MHFLHDIPAPLLHYLDFLLNSICKVLNKNIQNQQIMKQKVFIHIYNIIMAGGQNLFNLRNNKEGKTTQYNVKLSTRTYNF